MQGFFHVTILVSHDDFVFRLVCILGVYSYQKIIVKIIIKHVQYDRLLDHFHHVSSQVIKYKMCNILCLNKYTYTFLNQAYAGLWLPHAWFLETDFVSDTCIYVCVCMSTLRLLITSDVMWLDMVTIWLVKQVLQHLYASCSQYY